MVVRGEQGPAGTAVHGVVVSVPLSGARHAPFPKRCEYLYMTSSSRIARLAWPVLLLAALAFPAIASAQSGDHVTLGAGAGVVPDYQGSDDYRFLPIPVIDAQFGQFFVSLRNGIGVNVIEIRSEEHTSELQSLMRISYAVFCLHKKNTYHTHKIL